MRALIFLALTCSFSALSPAGSTVAAPATAAHAESPRLFSIEMAAQKHCRNDEVVWLNTATGIYHEKGMRWYGRTKHGAYVCRREADAVGDRDTKNGQ
jgi:hypothetical protein